MNTATRKRCKLTVTVRILKAFNVIEKGERTRNKLLYTFWFDVTAYG